MSSVFVGSRNEDAGRVVELNGRISLSDVDFLDLAPQVVVFGFRHKVVLNLFQNFLCLFSRLRRNADNRTGVQNASHDTEHSNEE